MLTRQVSWYEGMLVLPQHFQAATQYFQQLIGTAGNYQSPYFYGLRSINIDDQALVSDHKISIVNLTARLRDGTIVSIPENGIVTPLEIKKTAFKSSPSLYVHLLLPDVIPGRQNAMRPQGEGEPQSCTEKRRSDSLTSGEISAKQKHPSVRYLIEECLYDELYSGGNPRVIDILDYNLQLACTPDATPPAGFESLILFRLIHPPDKTTGVAIDPSYIPASIDAQVLADLNNRLLSGLVSQLSAFAKNETERLRTEGGWNSISLPNVHKSLMRLHAIQSSLPVLSQLISSSGIHPFHIYQEFVRLIGQMSIVRSDLALPEIPAYDHDNLGPLFYELKQRFDAMLRPDGPVSTVRRVPFIGTANWLEVGLDAEWLKPNYQFFIGIQCALSDQEIEWLFAENHLDWKLGSRSSIIRIFRNAEAGVNVTIYQNDFSPLPRNPDLTYFQIDACGQYWEEVVAERVLALMVNQRFVTESNLGQNQLTVVDAKGESHKLKFELYVVGDG